MRYDRRVLDFVDPPRSVALSLVSGRGHYERVVRAVLEASCSVWIATATFFKYKLGGKKSKP